MPKSFWFLFSKHLSLDSVCDLESQEQVAGSSGIPCGESGAQAFVRSAWLSRNSGSASSSPGAPCRKWRHWQTAWHLVAAGRSGSLGARSEPKSEVACRRSPRCSCRWTSAAWQRQIGESPHLGSAEAAAARRSFGRKESSSPLAKERKAQAKSISGVRFLELAEAQEEDLHQAQEDQAQEEEGAKRGALSGSDLSCLSHEWTPPTGFFWIPFETTLRGEALSAEVLQGGLQRQGARRARGRNPRPPQTSARMALAGHPLAPGVSFRDLRLGSETLGA